MTALLQRPAFSGVNCNGSKCHEGTGEIAVRAGDFWRTPGGVEHSVRTGDVGAVVLDVFAPPREEYRKPGEGFGD